MSSDFQHPAPTPVPERVRRFDQYVERWAAQLRRRPMVDRAAYALSEAGNHSMVWHGINPSMPSSGPP